MKIAEDIAAKIIAQVINWYLEDDGNMPQSYGKLIKIIAEQIELLKK